MEPTRPDGLQPEYSDATNAFIDGAPFPSPNTEDEDNHMADLVKYNLPQPHQHVDAPSPDAIPDPPRLSTTVATPAKKRKAKATPKAPVKRRRNSTRSPSCSPSPLPTWTNDEKQKLRTLKSDEKSRFSWRARLFPPDEANAIQFGQLRPQLTTRLRTQWDIQMIASDLEFRYADLTGDVFQVREDWTILQLLDGYRPDWRIRQYNYMESSLVVTGSQQPFILRLTCHKVRQGFILP